MAKVRKRYTVLCEQNIRNLKEEVVLQRLIYYFASDSLGMAESITASLQRIDHSWRLMDGNKVLKEWIREGFQCA